MILETTNISLDKNDLIKDLVGKPFGIFRRIKSKGLYSKRLNIDQVSPNFNGYINNLDENNANLELRPFGVIVKIHKGLKKYSWVIPFNNLELHIKNGISIHSNGKFIHFKNNKTLKQNKSFFDKLLNQKVKCEFQNKSNLLF